MSEMRARVKGYPVTHVVSWSSDVGGTTRCGLRLSWSPNDFRAEAMVVDCDCDCMTCLVRESEGNFYLNLNVAAFVKLNFNQE